MAEGNPDVTLNTLHDDMTNLHDDMTGLHAGMTAGFADLKGEMRAGVADLKVTLIAGFRSLPGREASEEMIRLLREGNRIQDGRFTQLDLRLREQHFETQQVLHAIVEGQRLLFEAQRSLTTEVRALAADVKALIARIDALIKGRDNGEPTR